MAIARDIDPNKFTLAVDNRTSTLLGMDAGIMDKYTWKRVPSVRFSAWDMIRRMWILPYGPSGQYDTGVQYGCIPAILHSQAVTSRILPQGFAENGFHKRIAIAQCLCCLSE